EHFEHCHQTRRIVAHAGSAENVAFALHLDVGAFGKDGIHMRGEDDGGSAARPLAYATDVGDFVSADLREPELLHLRPDIPRAGLLFRGWRGNFYQLDPFVDNGRGSVINGLEGFAYVGALENDGGEPGLRGERERSQEEGSAVHRDENNMD